MRFYRKGLTVDRYRLWVRQAWWRIWVAGTLRRRGVEVLGGSIFYGFPVVSMAPESRITIRSRAALCSVCTHTALGVNHPVVLRTLRPGAVIDIGEDAGISGVSICAAIRVEVGSNVLIGANATVVDTDFHALKAEGRRYNGDPRDIQSAPVRIEDNVFIGAGAYILKGVTVGRNSVIGAGSIVTRSVPENFIAVGNPARAVGEVPR